MSGQEGFVLVLKEQHRGLLLISVVKPLQLSPPSDQIRKTPVLSLVHTRKTLQHFPQPPSRKTVSAALWNKLSGGEYSLTNLFFNYVSAPVDVRALSNLSLLSTLITSMLL